MEREGDKHQCVVAYHMPLTRDLACNPGMCPDWESNQQLFSSQAGTQSTEPHQPGHERLLFFKGLQNILLYVDHNLFNNYPVTLLLILNDN